jgi:uncharacterized SAM-binding protein YcdF (DUF218 family)
MDLSDRTVGDARTLWDFHRLSMTLEPCDFILALGSHDERVAAHAASLFLRGLAPLLVTSGGFGKVTRGTWKVPEGQRFAEIARELGVPRSSIVVEDAASNTGDNVVNTRALLLAGHVPASSGILVTKPYMCRRAFATAAKQWPEVRWYVSAPEITFADYSTDDVPLRRMISLMVGDLQRLRLYAAQGFQIPQDIPPSVWEAYERLRDAGYHEFVIEEAAS